MSGFGWRAGLVGAFVLVMGYFAVANFIPQETRVESGILPDKGLRLGLDLQGGIHWVVGVEIEDPGNVGAMVRTARASGSSGPRPTPPITRATTTTTRRRSASSTSASRRIPPGSRRRSTRAASSW